MTISGVQREVRRRLGGGFHVNKPRASPVALGSIPVAAPSSFAYEVIAAGARLLVHEQPGDTPTLTKALDVPWTPGGHSPAVSEDGRYVYYLNTDNVRVGTATGTPELGYTSVAGSTLREADGSVAHRFTAIPKPAGTSDFYGLYRRHFNDETGAEVNRWSIEQYAPVAEGYETMLSRLSYRSRQEWMLSDGVPAAEVMTGSYGWTVTPKAGGTVEQPGPPTIRKYDRTTGIDQYFATLPTYYHFLWHGNNLAVSRNRVWVVMPVRASSTANWHVRAFTFFHDGVMWKDALFQDVNSTTWPSHYRYGITHDWDCPYSVDGQNVAHSGGITWVFASLVSTYRYGHVSSMSPVGGGAHETWYLGPVASDSIMASFADVEDDVTVTTNAGVSRVTIIGKDSSKQADHDGFSAVSFSLPLDKYPDPLYDQGTYLGFRPHGPMTGADAITDVTSFTESRDGKWLWYIGNDPAVTHILKMFDDLQRVTQSHPAGDGIPRFLTSYQRTAAAPLPIPVCTGAAKGGRRRFWAP